MSAMALSFWAENRRVSNDRLCNMLGYELLHPHFKAGLRDCARPGLAQGDDFFGSPMSQR